MKQIILALFLLTSGIFISSCGSNSGSGTDPFGPGGGGTGTVTYTTTLVQDQQQNFYFRFTPSTGATVETITVTCTQLQINNQVVTADGTTVFTTNNPVDLGPVQNLAAGQQWTFVIKGKVGSNTGAAYTANTSYTVQ